MHHANINSQNILHAWTTDLEHSINSKVPQYHTDLGCSINSNALEHLMFSVRGDKFLSLEVAVSVTHERGTLVKHRRERRYNLRYSSER